MWNRVGCSISVIHLLQPSYNEECVRECSQNCKNLQCLWDNLLSSMYTHLRHWVSVLQVHSDFIQSVRFEFWILREYEFPERNPRNLKSTHEHKIWKQKLLDGDEGRSNWGRQKHFIIEADPLLVHSANSARVLLHACKVLKNMVLREILSKREWTHWFWVSCSNIAQS